MNFYRLNMSYNDEGMEDGIGWDNEILMHKEKYTKEEFENICNMARKKCKEEHGEVLLDIMTEILIEYFGFKQLETSASFDFHEEY